MGCEALPVGGGGGGGGADPRRASYTVTVFCHVQCTPVYNVHPRFLVQTFRKKSFVLMFQFNYLFIYI